MTGVLTTGWSQSTTTGSSWSWLRKPSQVNSDSAALAWLGLTIVIIAWVVGYDLWAHFTQHLTMSAQFHRWLKSSVWGPIMFAFWIGIPAGLLFHFFVTK